MIPYSAEPVPVGDHDAPHLLKIDQLIDRKRGRLDIRINTLKHIHAAVGYEKVQDIDFNGIGDDPR